MKFIFSIFFITFCITIFCQTEQRLNQFYNSNLPVSQLNNSSVERLDSIWIDYKKKNEITSNNEKPIKEFVYKHNFFLENLNKSGRVFYGDEISKYLNLIKDNILINHPRKNEIKVLLTNFTQLNAFTNDFGTIYVNIATVAKLENEIELYALLAHEISHVLSRHSFKIENKDNSLSKDKFDGINEVNELDYHKFSQKQELEADSLAYILLKDIGLNISNLESLFDKLQHSNNPIFETPININNLSKTNNYYSTEYLKNLHLKNKDTNYVNRIIKNDELTTHPSVEQRLQLYRKILKSDSTSAKNTINSSSTFVKCKELASLVLVQTLLSEHSYIESLYLVEQLLTLTPNNNYLIKIRLKLLLLITQSKYLNTEQNIVNEFGNSCSNKDYLLFRNCILQIPALEMNMLTILELKGNSESGDSLYFKRLLSFSYQFLYKYNTTLFKNIEGNLTLIKNLNYKDFSYAFNMEKVRTTEQNKLLKEDEKKGFLVIDEYHQDSILAKTFITEFKDQNLFNDAILDYKKRRTLFENMLTLDQLAIDFDPEKSYVKYKNGKFIAFKNIPSSVITALIQSDTYCFFKTKRSDEIYYEQSLFYENMITNLINKNQIYSIDLSNKYQKNKPITVADNHSHHLLSSWIGECLNFSDLVYSVLDEEFSTFILNLKVDYLVYNLNLVNFNPFTKTYQTLFYEIYFDVNTMGIAYVSVISGNKKPNERILKEYFNLSKKGKTLHEK